MDNETKTVEVKVTAQGLVDAIQSAFMMPIKRGPVVRISQADMNLLDFGKCNALAFERMVGQIMVNATKGDIPSANWLMKYTGLEPTPRQEISIDAPVIYNDVPMDDHLLGDGKPPVDDVPTD